MGTSTSRPRDGHKRPGHLPKVGSPAHTPFSTIVVPLDLEPDHDRAVAVAALLGSLGDLPIELVTVSSPGLSEATDQLDLHRIATRHQLVRWTSIVLHDNEPARAIAGHLSTLVAPLLLIASEVHGVFGELGSRDTAAHLLAEITCPALVLGPRMGEVWRPAQAELLCCVGPTEPSGVAIPAMTRWLATFGGAKPTLVSVIDTANSPIESADQRRPSRIDDMVDDLFAASGVHADSKVLDAENPVEALLQLTNGDLDAVLVVTSERWAGESRLHLHSIARRLAHSSINPVLVVSHTPVTDA